MKTRTVITVRKELTLAGMTSTWDVTLDGVKVIHGGRRRSWVEEERPRHQGHTRRFSTELEARAYFDKLLEETDLPLTARVDRQIASLEPSPHVDARDIELESRLTSAADLTAYADWLQAQGDLRGALAALHRNGHVEEAANFLEANLSAFFPGFESRVDTNLTPLRWRAGLLCGVGITVLYDEKRSGIGSIASQFLSLPIARFVDELHFQMSVRDAEGEGWKRSLVALTDWEHARQLSHLYFNEFSDDMDDLPYVRSGDFSDAWKHLPSLETLFIRAGPGGNLGRLRLPRLRTFIRESGALSADELEQIIAAEWPLLEHLEVWFGSRSDARFEQALRLIESAPASVRRFGLVGTGFVAELIAPLAASRVLSGLRVLDLSGGDLLDEQIGVLIQHRAAFAHLERLDLSKNLLNTAGKELMLALPHVVLANQRYEDEKAAEGYIHLK